jgi:predicted alpha/beta-fold hydrolase
MAGFSAGTNMLHETLLHLQEEYSKIKINGVFLQSVSWDYTVGKKRLENYGIQGLFYSSMLALQFKVIISQNISEYILSY